MRTAPVHFPSVQPHPERWRDLGRGVWRLVDSKIALASLIPFVTGVTIAFDQHAHVAWSLAAAAFVAIFLVEVGKNAVNDLYDFRSGADTAVTDDERSPFSGGKRVLVDHLLTESDLTVIAWIAFGLAATIGLQLATVTRPSLFLIGGAAAAISVLYAMPPVQLSYRGLGELAVFAVYGPGIVFGAALLLNARITAEVAIVAVTLGLLIANVLLINEVPDERADRVAGKKTLVVRLGRDRTESLLAIVFTVAFAIPAVAAVYGAAPFRLAGFLLAVPAAGTAVSLLRGTRSGPPVAAQTATLITYVLAGLGYSAAVFLLRGAA